MIALAYLFAFIATVLGLAGIAGGALLVFAWFYDRWLCRAAHRRRPWTYGVSGQPTGRNEIPLAVEFHPRTKKDRPW